MNTDKPRFQIRCEHLELAFAKAPITGYVVECGVARGTSLRWLVSLAHKNQRIFGFDSFEGLPEDWVMSEDITVPAGAFECEIPDIEGAELRLGLFSESLPTWKTEHPGRIAFLHIDADLYSSAVTILEELNDQIVPGTVIAFDDMFESLRHQYWEQGEYKAFQEWQKTYDRKVYKLFDTELEQASFRIIQ